ncbi:MAG TPA: XisI protein [Nostocaceae cyanobacterium]|nr:XisI protein [Nostocaceae cyanobacterium]
MDRLEKYRQIIQKFLTDLASEENPKPDYKTQLVIDKEHDHYLLLDVGWQGLNRIHDCFLHLDIIDGKIWIQDNMTERDIAQELVNLGVLKEDIVLGLHPPYKRPYTGYGVA